MSFILFAVLVIALFPFVAFSEPSKKHPGPCQIAYPSDAAIEWECRRLKSGESLEKLFGERWIDVARFNRIDRRHAHSGASLKVPKRLDDAGVLRAAPAVVSRSPSVTSNLSLSISRSSFSERMNMARYGLRCRLPPATEATKRRSANFRITAAHRSHQSCLYTIEGTNRPYPMNHALRFHVNRAGVSYWIHGRDLPGYPASHGCVGLYDESMQKEQYGIPKDPEVNDAKRLFEWVSRREPDDDRVIPLPDGPRLQDHRRGAEE